MSISGAWRTPNSCGRILSAGLWGHHPPPATHPPPTTTHHPPPTTHLPLTTHRTLSLNLQTQSRRIRI